MILKNYVTKFNYFLKSNIKVFQYLLFIIVFTISIIIFAIVPKIIN